jgi:hypothetical protein
LSLPLSKQYSAAQIRGMYKKLPAAHSPRPLLHIHIDAHEPVPDELARELATFGYVRDDFLSPLPHRQANTPWPANHLTWKGSAAQAFRDAWRAADERLLDHGIWSYLEGEIVRLDTALDQGLKSELDPVAFDRLCPRATTKSNTVSFESPVLDAANNVVGSELRELPFRVTQRQLRVDPHSANDAELFRSAEVHLTIRRTGVDARLLALLKAIGLSDPIIPKVVVDRDGEPVVIDGAPLVIEDMPMTLQAVKSAPSLVALFDLIVKRVLGEVGGIGNQDIDGIERVSVKYEPAPVFGLYSGRNADGSVRRVFDPRTDLPRVVASIIDRAGNEMTPDHLASLGASTSSIAGHSLMSDERLLTLAGLWAELRQSSRWVDHWRVVQLPAEPW